MAIRKILHEGDETLRKKSKEVVVFSSSLTELLKDMEETMVKADGAGLSAVQVGILKRAFVMMDKKDKVWVVNPVILSKSGKNLKIEGCLSVPDKCGLVERPNEILVKYQDEKGNFIERKFTGFSAKAFCHEYDHLDGILYTDRATKMFNNYDEYFSFKEKVEKKEKKNKTKGGK